MTWALTSRIYYINIYIYLYYIFVCVYIYMYMYMYIYIHIYIYIHNVVVASTYFMMSRHRNSCKKQIRRSKPPRRCCWRQSGWDVERMLQKFQNFQETVTLQSALPYFHLPVTLGLFSGTKLFLRRPARMERNIKS